MLAGEGYCLNVINKSMPDFCPRAAANGQLSSGGAYLATTFLDLKKPRSSKNLQTELGTLLARMHQVPSPNGMFGFNVPTYCGPTYQDNSWTDTWSEFWKEKRLKPMLTNIKKDHPREKQLLELGFEVAEGCDKLFKGIEVKPSLLHGDLCRS